MSPLELNLDEHLDLKLERVVDATPAEVWAAWTQPELLKQWFCPRPWAVSACEIDLRPGGRFNTTMCSPEGEEHPSSGCFLEVIEGRRLAFTDAMTEGFRPTGGGFMTGVVTLTPEGTGTRYVAVARHADPEATQTHRDMGFLSGWGTALDQMLEMIHAQRG